MGVGIRESRQSRAVPWRDMLYRRRAGWYGRLVALGILVAGVAGAVPTDRARMPDSLDTAIVPLTAGTSDRLKPSRGLVTGIAHQGEKVLAVGGRGLILVSNDSGANWRQVPSPVATDLVLVRFSSPTTAWAVGHDAVILRSDDGGDSWVRVLDGRAVLKLLRDAYPASTSPALAREVEAGAAQSATADVWPAPILDIWFSDEAHGFAVGAFGLVLRTQDGGQHWQPWLDHVDNENRYHLYAAGGRQDHVFLAGEQGLLLHLDPRTDRFVRLKTPYNGTFFGVEVVDGKLLAFGLRGNAYVSADGGARWRKLETGTDANLVSAVQSEGRVMLVSQAGDVLLADLDAGVTTRLQVPAGQDVFAAVPVASNRLAVARVSGPALLEWSADLR